MQPLLNVHVPRGSTFSQSVSLRNPSKSRRLRVLRVAPSDRQLRLAFALPGEPESAWPASPAGELVLGAQETAVLFALRFDSANSTRFEVRVPRGIEEQGWVSVSLEAATLTIPVEIISDVGLVQTRPKALFLGVQAQRRVVARG